MVLGWWGGFIVKGGFGGDFGGKRGCGSKPFAPRLNRFSNMFVGCVVISLLSLSDFGRRLGLSPMDFGRRLSSRFYAAFVSCITVFLCLLDFGRRLLSRFTSLSDFCRRPFSFSGYGRRL